MASIAFKNIAKSYGPTPVIRDVSLDVRDGEFMVFVGPSGCGKSTMLRMVAGLESITAGDLLIDGQKVNERGPAERGAAMVFQSYALYPHMTVAQNMGFGLRMGGTPKADVTRQVQAAAETLQITHLLDRYPKQLSGGQRQRVAIGRAIVRRPKVFLFDEPLSNLDAALRVQLRIELAKLHQQLKTTMIYVTHDQTEAMTLGERIAVFNQGRIEQLGTPVELYQKPVNRFVAEFLGSPKINVIPYQMLEGALRIGGQQLSLESWCASALVDVLRRGCLLGVRPEAFLLAHQGTGLTGQVEFLENLGDVRIAYVRVAGLDELTTVKLGPQAPAVALGEAVVLSPQTGQVLVFDAQGQTLF
ncbi:MAG: sn-glycerol-3-phosphate ABC transporter ATP-binding protein UgpC [Comamonadaceae bacterium]|nr:sn-glycerol-3-phosphate ABC transporter ATP-binding protein UgpC [Comamonadaceae bacterium]